MSKNYTIYRCEECHQAFYLKKSCRSVNGQDEPLDGTPEGSYHGKRFCSQECAKAWCESHPGQSPHTFGERLFLNILLSPIKVPLWVCKMLFKIMKPVLKNKWTWTIFTCGLSLVAWKMLNAIYAPKGSK